MGGSGKIIKKTLFPGAPRAIEYVEGAEKERREGEARDEAEAAVAWQSVGLQEEDPMWSAGGLDL